MGRLFFLLLFLVPTLLHAQLSIGLKGGLNFANVTSSSGISTDGRTGYMLGAYISPKPKKLLGFRSEFILSRQGYNYKTGTSSGNVNLDYLLLPQLITVNFTKKVQLHAGGQLAFLMNADVDSTGSGSGSLFDYFQRFDYGLAAGAELSPLSGFFIGARINISLKNVREDGTGPSFLPGVDAKNNVAQLYAGWRF